MDPRGLPREGRRLVELAREGKGFEEKGSGLWSVRGRGSGSIPFVLRRGFRGSAARKWGHPVCGGCMAMAGVTPPGLSLWEGVEWSRKSRCRVGPASRRGQPRVGTGCPLPRQPCALHQSLCRSQVRCVPSSTMPLSMRCPASRCSLLQLPSKVCFRQGWLQVYPNLELCEVY